MNSVLNYQLPENWTETELRNLIAPSAKIIYGIIQPGIDVANGVPFVRGGDICDGKTIMLLQYAKLNGLV